MATWYDGSTFLVEVEFTSGVWTDITAYVMDVQIDRGRAYERDSFQPGRLSLVLDNRDRRFDPEHSGGPYAPLKAMRQVRVTFNGTRIYTGWIQGWPQNWSDPSNVLTTCTVFALDALTILATMALPESRYFADVLTDAPAAYYRLGESTGATFAVDSSGNGRTALYGTGQTPSTSVASLVSYTSDAARQVKLDPAIGNAGFLNVIAGGSMYAITGAAFSWECWISPGTISRSSSVFTIYRQADVSATNNFTVTYTRSVADVYTLSVAGNDGSGLFTLSAVVTSTFTEGSRHHVAYTRNGVNATLYLDGAAIASSGAVPWGGTFFGASPSLISDLGTVAGPTFFVYDELAMYSTALSAGRVLAHYNAGATGSAGQTVDARISTVLTDAGYTGSTSLEASAQTVQAANYAGANTLAYLQTLERTEQGRLFVNASGALTFHARYHDLLNSSFAVVVSDDAASSFRYAEMQTEFSVGRVANDVTASRSGGVAQRVKDATSAAQPPTGYGTRSLSIDGLLGQSDLEVNDLATYVVQRNKDPQTRVPTIRILPRVSPSTWFSVVASLEIGAKVSFVRTPQGVGSGVNKSVIVEAIRWRLTPQGDFDYELQTSPVDDVNGNFLVLDDSTRGQLDSNRLGF